MIDIPLRIIQANLNRSAEATESALELGIREKSDLIMVQEPWMLRDQSQSYLRSIAHSAYQMIIPKHNPQTRPRVLAYAKRSLNVQITPHDLDDPDIQSLIVQDTKGKRLQIINVYNEKDQGGHWTLDRALYRTNLLPNCVMVGDFNIRHALWDPNGNDNSSRANTFVNWIDTKNFLLQNQPNIGTFYRTHMDRPSVLDLTFTRGASLRRDINWRTIDIGSDHLAISIDIASSHDMPAPIPEKRQAYDTRKADWEGFTRVLKDLATTIVFTDNLDQLAEDFSETITTACNRCIPKKRTSPHSKPWWTPELRQLRREMAREQRRLHAPLQSLDRQDKEAYLVARNRYFLAIKNAKRDHWNQFLEKTDPKSIFKAMAYTKPLSNGLMPAINGQDTFEGKCDELRKTLFPEPPPDQPLHSRWNSYQVGAWKWEPLGPDELQAACSASKIKGKTPGPDGITQEIIGRAYSAVPDTFLKVYSTLITRGHHPRCWKQATGVTLAKPNKPDYTLPKAYRIISLLNCLGKVSERIMANRLSAMAEAGPLLHPSQMGGRKKRSAVDTALLLTDFVERNREKGRKSSAVFLDVKGAFDHVAKGRLLQTLIKLRLPYSVVSWTMSFLKQRLVRLAFDGQMEEFREVETGVPQGSPVSPILFLIYISNLFSTIQDTTTLSYIDDVGLLTASTSLAKNARILQREVERLTHIGTDQSIQFDLAKTELIHFTKGKGSDSSITLPSGETIQPAKKAVRWLGVWFDPQLTFKEHIRIRATQAYASFLRMDRLANSERGLTSHSLRQIYKACITSVADYGAPVWWKSGRSTAPLQAIQTRAAKKILGVFRTSPTEPVELEAGLLPPLIRIERQVAQYGLRLMNLPHDNPTAKALQDTCLPRTRIPITDGYEIVRPKARTRLQAIKHRNTFFTDTLPENKQQIQQATDRAWRTSYQKAKNKKQGHPGSYFQRFAFTTREAISVKCERTIASALYSLRLGHGYFRSYLYRFHKVESDNCRCGGRETPEHLLLACPLYNNCRPERLRNARSLDDVMSDKDGLKDTIEYLQKTRIATRSWYLKRAEEFEEEEEQRDYED